MAATAASTILGTTAPDFRLPATDGKSYALKDVAGTKGTGDRLHLQSLPLRQSRH
jgi:hypothetical protein